MWQSYAKQNLDCPQVRTVFEQVSGKTVSQRVRMDLLADSGTLSGFFAGLPNYLRRNQMIGRMPAVAGKQPDGRFTPKTTPVLAQDVQQVQAKHDIPVLSAFATLNMNDAARTIDIRDLQACLFGPPESSAIQCH